jgi:hypothetical protein
LARMSHKQSSQSQWSHVRDGSWLCENARALNRDRRSYSSKTALVAQSASGFNLEIELENIILRRVSIFEFLHARAFADMPSQRRHVHFIPESGHQSQRKARP